MYPEHCQIMNLHILRKVGLSEGEIRVYSALILLGKSTTGDIMNRANISSSKVYLILDKLIHRGLVSFVIEDNIKHYQITSPEALLDSIEEIKSDFAVTQGEIEELIPVIGKNLQTAEKDSAQIYRGLKGIQAAYLGVLRELKHGEEYRFFAVNPEEVQDKRIAEFLAQFHTKRVALGIKARAIADPSVVSLYRKEHILNKQAHIRKYPLTLPNAIVIGKTRILIISFAEDSVAYEIVSVKLAQRYQDFFDKIWKQAK